MWSYSKALGRPAAGPSGRLPELAGRNPHDVRDLVELTPLILAVAVTYRQVMGMTEPGRGLVRLEVAQDREHAPVVVGV